MIDMKQHSLQIQVSQYQSHFTACYLFYQKKSEKTFTSP
uniref:Uncharacterized protein n=1 Tax=Arundo donax TaxID=35708 RepID=A0A0A9H389_ARUDO